MDTDTPRRPRKRRPFAAVKQQTAGWYAIGRHGMSSGPWATEAEATEAARKWNEATA